MSSTSTEYEFTSSLEKDSNLYLTKDRQYIYYNDLQGGNYNQNSSEVKFELISLANTNQFVNWAESFLTIPLQLSVAPGSGTTLYDVAGPLPENAFALSLKNGYQHLVDSLLIQVNDNSINQTCNGANVEMTWRLYQMSADDRKTLGDMMQFYLDTGDSVRYIPNPGKVSFGTVVVNSVSTAGLLTFDAAQTVVKGQTITKGTVVYTVQTTTSSSATCTVSPAPAAADGTPGNATISTPYTSVLQGIGECNNVISKATGFNPALGYQAVNGVVNEGRRQRMMSTSFDPVTSGNPLSTYYQTAAQTAISQRNCVVQNDTNNGIIYNIFATIPMAILHDFFDKLPIARGLSVRLNLYLNTGITINESIQSFQHVGITSAVVPRQTVPFMVSPISNDSSVGSGFKITGSASTLTYQLKLGNSSQSNCRFYASMYQMNPQTESLYISSPERTILYNDVVQYVIPSVGPTQTVNQLITSGISRLRGLLMVPIISASSNGGTNLDGKQSIFSSCPGTTFPYSKIQNFQIQVSGKPVFNTPISTSFMYYNTMLKPELSINGGSLRSIGMSSGCISKTDFESAYSYYYVDLLHLENEADDNLSKSIQVLFTNSVAGALNVDYYIYLTYQRELHLNISNGAFLSI